MELVELIRKARSVQCSDLHITAGDFVAVRRFGELKLLDIKPTIEETEKMLFDILNDEDIRRVKNGEDIDVAASDESGGRLRINIYHQRRNFAASIRLLDANIPSFEDLGLPGKLLAELASKRSGLVLVTGPTGSGKSTTLAAMIDYINNNMARHIITVEDPIEYVYGFKQSMIHQRQVGRDVPNFASALRSALREDPDVILVGEMRDYETINAAITAAETGHLVMSTLHTKSAAQTVERIISACPIEAQPALTIQLSSILTGVITQTLVPFARKEGRIAATEVMLNNTAVANLIKEKKTNQIQTVLQSNLSSGMHTLNYSLANLVKTRVISREAALKHSENPADLAKNI